MSDYQWLWNGLRPGATHAFARYASGVVRVSCCGVKRRVGEDWMRETHPDVPYKCMRCTHLVAHEALREAASTHLLPGERIEFPKVRRWR